MKSTHNSDSNINSLIKEELECLSSTLYEGDATLIVYNMLKDTRDFKCLLEHLTGEVIKKDVPISDTTETSNENSISRPSLEKWLTQFQQL